MKSALILSGTNREVKRVLELMRNNIPKQLLIKDMIQDCDQCYKKRLHYHSYDNCDNCDNCVEEMEVVIPSWVLTLPQLSGDDRLYLIKHKFRTIDMYRDYMSQKQLL